MADVFISYKRSDRETIARIAEKLKALNISVWYDARLDAGSSFDEEITRELRAAKCVLVCWSKDSVQSEWVRAEATEGRKRETLVSCVIEACDPYPPFNLVHSESVEGWRGEDDHEGWERLRGAVGRRLGRADLAGPEGLRRRRLIPANFWRRPVVWGGALAAVGLVAFGGYIFQPRGQGQTSSGTPQFDRVLSDDIQVFAASEVLFDDGAPTLNGDARKGIAGSVQSAVEKIGGINMKVYAWADLTAPPCADQCGVELQRAAAICDELGVAGVDRARIEIRRPPTNRKVATAWDLSITNEYTAKLNAQGSVTSLCPTPAEVAAEIASSAANAETPTPAATAAPPAANAPAVKKQEAPPAVPPPG